MGGHDQNQMENNTGKGPPEVDTQEAAQPMSCEEKKQLSLNISKLPGDQRGRVVKIKFMEPDMMASPDEMEIGFNALKPPVMQTSGSLENSNGEKPELQTSGAGPLAPDTKDGDEERGIAKAAYERAELEIAAKTGALRDLRVQKDEAARKVNELCSKRVKIKSKMEEKKRSLQEAEKETRDAGGKLAQLEVEEKMIKKKRKSMQSILQEKEDAEVLLVEDIRLQEYRLAKQEKKVNTAEKEVEEIQHLIKALVEEPGYNPSMLKKLEDQISERKEDLEFAVGWKLFKNIHFVNLSFFCRFLYLPHFNTCNMHKLCYNPIVMKATSPSGDDSDSFVLKVG